MLTSMGEVAKRLGIAESEQLEFLTEDADRVIKQYIGQDIEYTTYPAAAQNGLGDSGYYDGDGTIYLRLRATPVVTITSLYEDVTGRSGFNPDGSFASTTLLVSGTDYRLDLDGCLPGTSTRCSYSGLVERLGVVWPSKRRWRSGEIIPLNENLGGCIKVAYTAGYQTVPGDLQAAVAGLVGYLRRTLPLGGPVGSEHLGAYSYSMMQALHGAPELGSMRQMLARYRRVAI